MSIAVCSVACRSGGIKTLIKSSGGSDRATAEASCVCVPSVFPVSGAKGLRPRRKRHRLRNAPSLPQKAPVKSPQVPAANPPGPAHPVPVNPSVTPVTGAGAQHARKHRRRRPEKRSAAQKLRRDAAQTPSKHPPPTPERPQHPVPGAGPRKKTPRDLLMSRNTPLALSRAGLGGRQVLWSHTHRQRAESAVDNTPQTRRRANVPQNPLSPVPHRRRSGCAWGAAGWVCAGCGWVWRMCRGRGSGVGVSRVCRPGVSRAWAGCVAGVCRVCQGFGAGVRGWMHAGCPGARDSPPPFSPLGPCPSSTRVCPGRLAAAASSFSACARPRGLLPLFRV